MIDPMPVNTNEVVGPELAATSSVHTVRQEIGGVALFVGAIWAVYLLEYVVPLERFGLVPRRLMGLVGILSMTFLHGSLGHLISNTVPLFVLLSLLAGSRAQSWLVAALITLCGGGLLWLFGRSAIHEGASLLIFGLISFLISSGLYFERRPASVAIALLVGVLYGGTLLTGILPSWRADDRVSWDGHLCGAVAGVLVAAWLTGERSSVATSVPNLTERNA